jgi:hypothetical protein
MNRGCRRLRADLPATDCLRTATACSGTRRLMAAWCAAVGPRSLCGRNAAPSCAAPFRCWGTRSMEPSATFSTGSRTRTLNLSPSRATPQPLCRKEREPPTRGAAVRSVVFRLMCSSRHQSVCLRIRFLGSFKISQPGIHPVACADNARTYTGRKPYLSTLRGVSQAHIPPET